MRRKTNCRNLALNVLKRSRFGVKWLKQRERIRCSPNAPQMDYSCRVHGFLAQKRFAGFVDRRGKSNLH